MQNGLGIHYTYHQLSSTFLCIKSKAQNSHESVTGCKKASFAYHGLMCLILSQNLYGLHSNLSLTFNATIFSRKNWIFNGLVLIYFFTLSFKIYTRLIH